MTDDPKKPGQDDEGESTGLTETKIERPKRASDPAPDEKKADEKKAEKALDEDDDPTAAQTPLAKKDEKKDEKAVVNPYAPKKSSDADDDDGDEDDEDDDEEPAAPVRRPGKPPAPAAKRPAVAKRPAARPSANDGRRLVASGQNAAFLLITGAALIVLNIGLQGVSRLRIDTTRENKFTLSEKGTVHLLSTLKKPLKIQVYAPEGLATIDSFIRDLRDLLDEYVRYGGKDASGNDRVAYEIIYPDRLEGDQKNKAEAAAQEAGLRKEVIGEAKGGDDKGATIGEGFFGMVITYGGSKETLQQQQGFDEHANIGLEFLISKTIRVLRDRDDNVVHKIGFLFGHNERGEKALQSIFSKTGPIPFYDFQEVKLEKGDKPIDPSLDGLIVSQPEQELTTKELRRIDEFLMLGKTVAVFADKVHIKDADPSMNATFNGMGIDTLLAGYGVDYKPGILVDNSQFWTPPMLQVRGQYIQLRPVSAIVIADPGRSDNTFDTSFVPFFRLEQLGLPFAQEITIDNARAGGDAVKVTPVIRATPTIYTLTGTSISVHPDHTGAGGESKAETRSKGQEAILAVNLEGPIKSAFPGGGDGITPPATAAGKARLFVISSGCFLENPFEAAAKSPFNQPGMPEGLGVDENLMRYAKAYGPIYMQALFTAWHTVDWMAEETDLVSLAPKLNQEPELSYKNIPAPQPGANESPEDYEKDKQRWRDQIRNQQQFTLYTCTFGGPLVLMLVGLLLWYRRNTLRAAVKL